jgi:hypothetical protein
MEDIIENRGFFFKETVMTGDPQGESGGLSEDGVGAEVEY